MLIKVTKNTIGYTIEKGFDHLNVSCLQGVLAGLARWSKPGDTILTPGGSIGPLQTATRVSPLYCVMDFRGEVLRTSNEFFKLVLGDLYPKWKEVQANR